MRAVTIAKILKQQGLEPAPKRAQQGELERVLAPTLGNDRGGRFLHRGGVDTPRSAAFSWRCLYRTLDAEGAYARQENGLWMSQVARDLTDPMEGLWSEKRYLIHDRDPLFTADFLRMLAEERIESVRLPPRSPNMLGAL